MSTLYLEGNTFTFNNQSFELNDFFSQDFYDYLDKKAELYDENLNIVNEVYLRYIQPYKAIEKYFSNKHIDRIIIKSANSSIYSALYDYAYNNSICVDGISKLYKIKKCYLGYVNISLSGLYLLWKMIQIPKSNKLTSDKDEISIIRTQASSKKMRFLENVDIRVEDFNRKSSIYGSFTRKTKLRMVFKSWLNSYDEIKKYSEYVLRNIGLYSSYDVFEFYSKRILHTNLYEEVLEDFLSKNRGKRFYTGNNLDRFALIEEKLALKYDNKIICIPHGLEYGFKMPHCFTGDIFFTTSLNSSTYLNKIYKTEKFIFDENIAHSMFFVNHNNVSRDKKIVFFTEPREPEVNHKIINELLKLFDAEKMKLFVKLHPKDDMKKYLVYSDKVEFINDINEAIKNNIVISRKSTVLLEGLYNGSKTAAILINSKDKATFYTFPSLQDSRINVFDNLLELFEWSKHELLNNE